MRRRDHGRALREAMNEAGLSIPALAEATRQTDPTGRGVSRALIGFLVSGGVSARETCGNGKAELIAATLDKPLNRLFVDETPLGMPTASTSTGESIDGQHHNDAGP